jgi:ankyrin repeat protein
MKKGGTLADLAILFAILSTLISALIPLANWYYAGKKDLSQAVQFGDIDTVRYVLKWRPQHPLIHFALWQACRRGRIDIVKLLVEHGADVNYRIPNTGFPALLMAEAFGHNDIAKYLVEHGAIKKIKVCGAW